MTWLSDFDWRDGKLLIRKTDIALRFDGKVIAEIARWLPYLAILGIQAAGARLCRKQPRSIWYSPEVPRPWYMVRGAALWAGLSVARSRDEADIACYFDDVTCAQPGSAPPGGLNAACADVSKSHVADVFESVFGYPLSVDPLTHDGPVVEKSEKNGVHDGHIWQPSDGVRADCVYQRLIDTTDDTGSARDLRTLCVGGVPVVVWLKTKPAGARFAIHNRRAVLHDPADIYSPDERRQIGEFAARMGLDWGGLDVLRDRGTGRLYIVDVNKTDLGPVIALSWSDKMQSMELLSRALDALVERRCAARTAPERSIDSVTGGAHVL